MVRTQFGILVKQFMTDAGGEYKLIDLKDLFAELGVQTRTSIPHMHQQNGRVERLNRTLMEKAEALHFEACFPPSWWEFSVEYAVHVYNRTPARRISWKTPFEMIHGEKPKVSHLWILGCGAYVFIPEDVRVNKLAPRAEIMTFIGYTLGTKGYKFKCSPNNVVFHAVGALFDEYMFPLCPVMSMPDVYL
jgi:hypothetical protein